MNSHKLAHFYVKILGNKIEVHFYLPNYFFYIYVIYSMWRESLLFNGHITLEIYTNK